MQNMFVFDKFERICYYENRTYIHKRRANLNGG